MGSQCPGRELNLNSSRRNPERVFTSPNRCRCPRRRDCQLYRSIEHLHRRVFGSQCDLPAKQSQGVERAVRRCASTSSRVAAVRRCDRWHVVAGSDRPAGSDARQSAHGRLTMTADTLETLARQIKARLSKARDFETSGGLQLAEARRRVEAGEAGAVTWSQWCAEVGLADDLTLSPVQVAAARLDAAISEVHAAISSYLGACAQARSEHYGRTGRGSAHLDSAGRSGEGLASLRQPFGRPVWRFSNSRCGAVLGYGASQRLRCTTVR